MKGLYRDDMSYLDLVYGVSMEREYKVELNDIRIENDQKGGNTGIYGTKRRNTLAEFDSRLKEAEWFIEQACTAITNHERNLEAINTHLRELWLLAKRQEEEKEKDKVLDDFTGWLRVHHEAAKMVNANEGYTKACAVILAELNRLREGTDDRLTGDN